MTYLDPILQKIFTLLKDNLDPATIVSFYQGDPLMIPKSNLPCLIGVKDTTDIADESNAEDRHLMNYVITVIIDIRDYLEEDMADVHVADQKMWDLFEGRNEDYTLKTNSIVDILRKNEDLGNNAHIDTTQAMRVDYGFTIGKRGERSWACEGYLNVPVFYSQLR